MHLPRFATAALAASAILALSLTGCTNAAGAISKQSESPSASKAPDAIQKLSVDPAAQKLLPADIAKRGTVRIATDPTYLPFEGYADDNKTFVGLDIDLANSMSQVLGVKVEFVASGFDSIIPGLSSGKYDMSMSAFSVTEERKKNADFVVYHQSGSGLAVPLGNPKKLAMDALSLCGHTIGAESATTQGQEILPAFSDQCTKAGKKAIDIKLFPGSDKAITALTSGRVEAVSSGATALGYQAKITGAFELAKGGDYAPKPTGLVLPKGSALTPAVTAAFEKIVTTHAYKQEFAKWGINPSNYVTPDQVPVK